VTYEDILNYYLAHPPFEITDTAGYADLLNFASNITLQEISEIYPVIEETKKTTPDSPVSITDDNYILYDLKDIHPNLMNLLIATPARNVSAVYESILSQLIRSGMQTVANRWDGSFLSLIVTGEGISIIREWASIHIKKLIFQRSKIKLLKQTEYYFLYERYRNSDEIDNYMLSDIKELFETNLMLSIYQSDIFASEGGIRSVSLSGLSVSFNVPANESKVRALQARKDAILSRLSLDYDEDMIGVI